CDLAQPRLQGLDDRLAVPALVLCDHPCGPTQRVRHEHPTPLDLRQGRPVPSPRQVCPHREDRSPVGRVPRRPLRHVRVWVIRSGGAEPNVGVPEGEQALLDGFPVVGAQSHPSLSSSQSRSRDSTSRSERLRSRSTTCIASRSICRYKVAGWPASHLSRCVLRRASHRYSSCSTSSALTRPPLLISASRAILGTIFQTFSEKSQLAVASALLRATCNSLQRIRSWSGRQPFESITRPSTPVPDSCPETFRHHDEPLSEVGAMKYIRPFPQGAIRRWWKWLKMAMSARPIGVSPAACFSRNEGIASGLDT